MKVSTLTRSNLMSPEQQDKLRRQLSPEMQKKLKTIKQKRPVKKKT